MGCWRPSSVGASIQRAQCFPAPKIPLDRIGAHVRRRLGVENLKECYREIECVRERSGVRIDPGIAIRAVDTGNDAWVGCGRRGLGWERNRSDGRHETKRSEEHTSEPKSPMRNT